ncbi:LysR family transcriptional regulator [Agromyces sp. Leaf222]|uniref:LysR family transcriptional regulator n=1 Tax=Agromyces sp. Leaf222 TaxID=1735688 RepID=UPI0006FF64EB|nr:LysR family transcriptional regulator [Agromyces sp. Leaf222]KQM83299.1 hypothetical protein ASE68_08790 [Agromyces sp. Leaf222]
MDTALLRHYVVVATELHLGRAAASLGVPRATLRTSLADVQRAVGAVLLERDDDEITLTEAGTMFLATARSELAVIDAANAPPKPKAGGKAKASKGKGRAPKVKGQPLPYKKRQSR